MAASGAGVLQLRSVEYARNHGVRIHCRSSFDDGPGTFVLDEDETMERPLVTAVTHSTVGGARHAHRRCPTARASPAAVLSALADANVNVDMIIQNEPVSRGRTRPTCRSPSRATTCAAARAALEPLEAELGFGDDRRPTSRWGRSRWSARE